MLPGMSVEDILCTQCGLCCDGTLLDDAELSGPAEADRLELLGLEVEEDDAPVISFPCAALDGTRCGIYPHRPHTCRTFECALLQETKAGRLTPEQARNRIRRGRLRAAQPSGLDARSRRFFLP